MEEIALSKKAFGVLEGVREGYRTVTYLDRIKALLSSKATVLTSLGEYEKKLEMLKDIKDAAQCAEKQKIYIDKLKDILDSVCDYCQGRSNLNAEEVKKLIYFTESDAKNTMNVMAYNVTKAIDDEVTSTISLARTDVWIDVSLSTTVVVSHLYFLFYSLEALKKEDELKIDRWAEKLARLLRRVDNLDFTNTEIIKDLIWDTEEILENVGILSSARKNSRNTSVVEGVTCLFKAGLNIFRYIYLRDPTSVADTFLYGSSILINIFGSGLSFWSAKNYHALKKEIDISWNLINDFLHNLKQISENPKVE